MFKTQNKWYIIAISILIVFLVYYRIILEKKPSEPFGTESLPTIKTVGALGRIEPRSRIINLSHDQGPDGGRIEQLLVKEGDVVRQGQVVATLSNNSRKQAQLELAQARAKMTEAKLEAELVNEKFYFKELERCTKLANSRVVSQEVKDQAEKDYNNSTANVKSLRAELISAQANVQLSKEELKQSILVSPLSGTVLKIQARPGERIGDYGVAEIADLTAIDIVAEIYERDMPRVEVGQKAEIKVPGFAEPFYGEVRELGFQVLRNSLISTDPLSTVDNRIIEVRVTVDPNMVNKLRHLTNMEVDVRLL